MLQQDQCAAALDFLAFTIEDWDHLFGCREAVLKRLAKRHKVLISSPPDYIRDLVNWHKLRPAGSSGLHQRGPNLHSLAPSRWLFENYRFRQWERLAQRLRIRQVRNVLRKLQFGPLALTIWHPRYVDMVGKFGECVSCYYVYDEISEFAGILPEAAHTMMEQDDRLLRSADIVFTAGAGLYHKKNVYGNAINVPNGVDFDLFSRALDEKTEVPADMDSIPRPRIAYVGNVNEKVNLELLSDIADRRPIWSFVFVGRTDGLRTDAGRQQFKRLCSHPNVYVLASQPKARVPGYLRGVDVCLIPYRMEGWALLGCPLKLHEYLATGKPVVSSNLPSVREFADVVRVAESCDEWISAIEASLCEVGPEVIEKRVNIALLNTWDRRVDTVETAIAEKVREKFGRATS